KEAAIINIQSIVSYVPNAFLATYSATKAALHSYSQSLRIALQKSAPNVKVFEVFPPYVDTDLTKGVDTDKLTPTEVADDIIAAVEKEEYAVRNGKTKDLYHLFRQSPEDALATLNAAE
ncbi:MAG TPA: SDR family NAD(P)-dependent oxidoreductase, partial [Chitinophaga sp.]